MNRFRLFSIFVALAATALIAALKNTQALKTGILELDGKVGMTGGQAASLGNVTFKGSGPFDVSDPDDPALDLEMEFGVAGQTQKIGIIVVDGKYYIEFAGQAIELDAKDAGSITELTDSIGPSSLGKLSENLDDNVTNVKKVGTAKVGDKTVVTYSAEIDFSKVLESLSGEGGSGLLSGLSGQNAQQAKDAFKAKTVEFGIDEDGNVVRSVHLAADIASPTGGGEGAGSFDIAVRIIESDEAVDIKAPENAIKGGGGQVGNLFGGMSGTN
jgi:hypothetical protein